MTDIRLKEYFSLQAVTMDFLLRANGQLDDREQLETSVRVALGSDAMAAPGDILPDPDSTDRRGWWGDLDAEDIWGGWPLGCKNWLLTRAKITDIAGIEAATLQRAQIYTLQALQPFVDQKIASHIEVTAERIGLEEIVVNATIFRGPDEEIALRYQVLWQEEPLYEQIPEQLPGTIIQPVIQQVAINPTIQTNMLRLTTTAPTVTVLQLGPSQFIPIRIAPSSPIIPTPILVTTGKSSLAPVRVVNTSPVLGLPSLIKNGPYALSGAFVINTSPVIGKPTYARGGAIRPTNLVNTVPNIGKPTLIALSAGTVMSASWATFNFNSQTAPNGVGPIPWWTNNSVWNAGSLVNGTDFTQSITVQPNTFPNNTKFTWSWPATPPASGTVYSFPELVLGTEGGSAPLTSITSAQINNIDVMSINHDIGISGSVADFDVKYLVYVGDIQGADTTPIFQFDIYLHTPSFRQTQFNAFPANQKYTFIDANGVTWTLIDNPSANPHQVIVVPQSYSDYLSGPVDVKGIMWAIRSSGIITGAGYFSGIALGVEPQANSGTMIVNSMSYSYTQFQGPHLAVTADNATINFTSNAPPSGVAPVPYYVQNSVPPSGTITNAFTPVAPNEARSDPNFSVRMICTLNAGAVVNKFVRITFRPAPTGGANTDIAHIAIGKLVAGGGYGCDTTAVPLEIKFGGASGINVAAGSSDQVSDWLDVSSLGLVGGDSFVLCWDYGAAGGCSTSRGNNNMTLWMSDQGVQTYNQASGAVGSFGSFGTFWGLGLVSMDTRSSATIVNGIDYTQSIDVDTVNFPKNTTITWSWGTNESSTKVWGTPILSWGTSGSIAPITTIAPSQINSITALTINHSFTISGDTAWYDVVYNVPLSHTAGPDTNPSHIIKVFAHTPSYVKTAIDAAATKFTYVDAQNTTWTVANLGGTPVKIQAYPSTLDILNYTFDFNQLFTQLKSHTYITGNEFFTGASLGSEPDKLTGTLFITAFTPTMTATIPRPTITGISPTTGVLGGNTSVVITGTNFIGATAVKFGANNAASFTVNSSTQITAVSPAGASGVVDVTVTTAGGTSAVSASDKFTYAAAVAPIITSVSPNTGPSTGATTVTITGTGFTGATSVKFGSVNASTFAVNSSTQITATSPAGSVGTVDITVTGPNGTSATGTNDQFSYTQATGSSITITGDWAFFNWTTNSPPQGCGRAIPYWSYNSVWNAGSLVNGTDYTQSIQNFYDTYPNGTIIRWSWPTQQASGLVYSFPMLVFGTYQGWVSPVTNITPSQVNNINTLIVTHNVSYTGDPTMFDVIYDFYLTQNPGVEQPGLFEVEVILHCPQYYKDYINNNAPNHPWPTYTWTDAYGTPWYIIWNNTGGSGSKGMLIFIRQDMGDILNLTFDLKAMFLQAKAVGILQGTEYFDGLGLGPEPSSVSGSLTINSISINYVPG